VADCTLAPWSESECVEADDIRRRAGAAAGCQIHAVAQCLPLVGDAIRFSRRVHVGEPVRAERLAGALVSGDVALRRLRAFLAHGDMARAVAEIGGPTP